MGSIRSKVLWFNAFATGAIAAVSVLGACSPPGNTDGGADSGTDGTSRACVPNEALIAARRECRADDQCPCGAHCELGQCIASCGASTACASGTTCDTFGRCVAPGTPVTQRAVSAAAPGTATVRDPLVRFETMTSIATIGFHAGAHDLGPVRETVPAGFELHCASGEWASECRETNVAAGTLRTLEVRIASGAPAPTAAADAHVFFSSEMLTVGLQAPGVRVRDAAGLGGVYTGTATLVDVDVSASAAMPVPQRAPRNYVIPVTANVFAQATGGAGVIALGDPLGAIHPDHAWNGAITVDGATGNGTIAFPAKRVHAGVYVSGTNTDVIMSAGTTTSYGYDSEHHAVSFVLTLAYDGAIEGSSLHARWHVDLQRQSDLPSGATPPAVPASDTPVTTMPRGGTATPWETVIRNTFNWTSTGNLAELRTRIQSLGDAVPAATSYSVAGCDPRPATFTSMDYGLLGNDAFHVNTTQTPAGGSPGTQIADLQSHDFYAHASIISPATSGTVTSIRVASLSMAPSDGIPCAMTFTSPVSCGTMSYAPIDRCAAIAQTYGCDVVTVTNHTATLSYTYSGTITCPAANPPTSGTLNTINANVTRMCVARSRSNCAEMVACMDPAANFTSSGAGVAQSVSGDRLCTTGTHSVATIADAARDTGTAATVATVLQNYLNDLAILRTGTPGTSVATIFGSPTAFDAVRNQVALAVALDNDRARAAGTSTAIDLRASRFAQRLLQQWLQVHALIAKESGQRALVPASLRGTAAAPVASIEDSLTASIAGWEVFLHPRIANALRGMPGEALASPDYRISAGPSFAPSPDNEQNVGLAVSMINTMLAEVQTLNIFLDRQARAGDGTVPAIAGATLRAVAQLLPVVADLHARAVAAAPTGLAWENRYQAAMNSLTADLSRAIGQASGIITRRNPLGIEDADLPLYFLGASTDPGARFSAISDYLVGTGPANLGWAPTLVAQAQTAAGAVSASYQAQAERLYQAQVAAVGNDDRLNTIRNNYGNQIANLCGTPNNLITQDILEHWDGFDGTRCFFRTDDTPSCAPDAAAYAALMSADDVRYQVCLVSEVNSHVSGVSTQLGTTFGSLVGLNDQGQTCTYPVACPSTNANTCMSCNGQVLPASYSVLNAISSIARAAQSAAYAQAQTTCRRLYPSARENPPALEELPNNPLARTDCYRGSIGELVLAIRAAQTDVEIARADAGNFQQNYSIAMQSCYIQQQGNAQINTLNSRFNDTMHSLGSAKLAMDIASNVAGAVKDCAQSQAVDAAGALFSGGAAVALGVVACAAGGAQAAFDSISDGLQFGMDEAQRNHDAQAQLLMGQTEVLRCINDAGMNLVGERSAGLRITRALQDLEAAQYRFQQAVGAAQGAYDEGREMLARERMRQVRPPSLDEWLDQNINTYRAAMTSARRAAYLAVRAVEYEYQASSTSRAAVLAAETPAELQSVINDLWNSAGTRSIGGHRPSSLKVIVSLRQNLLQLADFSTRTPDEQTLTDVQRFRLLLQDTRWAQYDASGHYIGQRIPFAVAPLGALRVGDPSGVSIFATTDCAERVWSVNASIMGTSVYRGSAATFARVDLEKSNTFYSQWCSSNPATEFQTASVRPSVNLFRDPQFQSASTIGSLGTANGAQTFTRARLQPVINVARADFENDMFSNGMSTELAARGLYGDYAIFIPAEQISHRNTDGTYSTGLDLDAIDDVLLRIDYVSVAR